MSPLEPLEELESLPDGRPPESSPRIPTVVAAAGILAVLALIWAWSRTDAPPTAARALPTPTTLDPSFRSDGTAPSVADGPTTALPTGSIAADSNTPDDGLAPWETPSVVIDYGPSQLHLAALLDALPPPWSIARPAAPANDAIWIDVTAAEAAGPFAARTLAHSSLGRIGQFWITSADLDDAPGVAFVRAAQAGMDTATVIETIDGGPGLELRRIESERFDVWVARYEIPTQVTFFVPRGTDPTTLLTFLEDWRLADLQLS